MTNKKYKKLYKAQLQIILNQLNQCNMIFKYQPGIFLAKSHYKIQKKLTFISDNYKFNSEDFQDAYAFAVLYKNIIMVNLECIRKYYKYEKLNKITFAKYLIYHELWHLYQKHMDDQPKLLKNSNSGNYLSDSVFQLTKNYFYKKLRNENYSEKEIIKKIKQVFENKNEFRAYLFTYTCLYKMPFAIEFFQKNFNVDFNQFALHDSLEE